LNSYITGETPPDDSDENEKTDAKSMPVWEIILIAVESAIILAVAGAFVWIKFGGKKVSTNAKAMEKPEEAENNISQAIEEETVEEIKETENTESFENSENSEE
jgi:uncharacterized membrane protein